jgi:hypothetical protein
MEAFRPPDPNRLFERHALDIVTKVQSFDLQGVRMTHQLYSCMRGRFNFQRVKLGPKKLLVGQLVHEVTDLLVGKVFEGNAQPMETSQLSKSCCQVFWKSRADALS